MKALVATLLLLTFLTQALPKLRAVVASISLRPLKLRFR
jgi:hypothetical protein